MAETLPIHDLGTHGDGVHHAERTRIYVDRALPGDTVRATLRQGDDGLWRGDVIDVLTSSPHRAPAPCAHYDVCGGCALQHATPSFYRDWKIALVRDALARRDLTPLVWKDPVFLPPGKRRRVTFAALKKNNIVTLGFNRRRSHQVTDVAGCLVVDPAIMDLRARLATLLVPILKEGKSADIFIQATGGQTEIVITGPVGKAGRPDLSVHEAIAHLAQTPGIGRIAWRARDRDATEVMIERSPLIARFGGLKVPLPPLAFLQPTQAGEDVLTAAVQNLLPNTGTFADLFAGCGTFTGPMLARGRVDAFEGHEQAVCALDKAKGVLPLRAAVRDLFRNPIRPEEAKRYDAIVFDPPRAGAQAQAKALAAGTVPLLVGVSCSPVSFARDARILVDGGYALTSVQVVDQFTWSHHVELVAAFTKN
jgi:23S rRNA (uracil1939-C5)-methyltransferase